VVVTNCIDTLVAMHGRVQRARQAVDGLRCVVAGIDLICQVVLQISNIEGRDEGDQAGTSATRKTRRSVIWSNLGTDRLRHVAGGRQAAVRAPDLSILPGLPPDRARGPDASARGRSGDDTPGVRDFRTEAALRPSDSAGERFRYRRHAAQPGGADRAGRAGRVIGRSAADGRPDGAISTR